MCTRKVSRKVHHALATLHRLDPHIEASAVPTCTLCVYNTGACVAGAPTALANVRALIDEVDTHAVFVRTHTHAPYTFVTFGYVRTCT
jgi:hypothetical protein